MPAAERGVAPGGVWDLLSGGARSVGYGGTLIHTHTADDPGSEGSVAPLHVNERETNVGARVARATKLPTGTQSHSYAALDGHTQGQKNEMHRRFAPLREIR